MLDAEWTEIFRQGNFMVDVSVDGTCEVHNCYCITVDGSPTYDIVENNIALLQKNGLAYNILCVVNRSIVPNGKAVFKNLQNHGDLRFIPCSDDFDGKPAELSLVSATMVAFCATPFHTKKARLSSHPVSVRALEYCLTTRRKAVLCVGTAETTT